ncbi:ABC transporter ATP-binding protein [Achromobacter piechaudii]|uniref:Lipopolysaccharide export system ATP-binding protein LptB n=2 Tax=Achromobacter piechaudii TaxID=72556 RepID=A0ABM8KQW9_9BURK|nr:ABC transporter ATP-binding protein [Achromobacter piechaudii]EFF77484.1 ABC transporter, ATP-binding protein [Achromobacter piechaudii ATCC 43553]KNY08358.1 branched-chain amino acid ABC transporter ATP-binding protein [Achromobacter piechaudii]CAB3653730.1 Lipopolysaccharide export system ATP-binding protein LptB [Achromobacter piechaudii]CAB3815931.1 Lipopolysaccharide export system ATP-binding protein LptB [Achromobacter piechaudii]CAB3946018.1 Lipopolysaccharide export system ATP-bindi
MLKVTNLKKRFGGLVALQGVDLEVPKGSILGIIGMNGSGKTTMLNCINGIYRPDEGRIELDGREIGGREVHEVARLGVGRTFQVPRIFRQLTLLENLEVAQQQSGRSADERYAQSEYWLHKVELHRLRHNYAEELSGGQQKLVELARIMVARPKVVLLDEPFAGVNPALAQLLISVIRELPTEHDCSVVLVSHDLTSIYQLSHHIIVMNEGAILSQGNADHVRADPQVVEAYLGA